MNQQPVKKRKHGVLSRLATSEGRSNIRKNLREQIRTAKLMKTMGFIGDNIIRPNENKPPNILF
jgi:ribosomal protein L34